MARADRPDAQRPPDRIVLGSTGVSWDGESVGAPAAAPERTVVAAVPATPAQLREALWLLQDETCVYCRRRIRLAAQASAITARTFIQVLRLRIPVDADIAERLVRRAAAMVDRSDTEILDELAAVVHTEPCFTEAVMLAHPTLTPHPVAERFIRRLEAP